MIGSGGPLFSSLTNGLHTGRQGRSTLEEGENEHWGPVRVALLQIVSLDNQHFLHGLGGGGGGGIGQF